MGKAIEGAALIGVAVGMGVITFMDPALLANPFWDKAWAAVAMAGIGMEVGAVASALTNTSGTTATVHQAAAPRQVIYGQRRVSGVTVYESTTGSAHDQVNLIIVLAGHECQSIENLYLDGRKVYWQGSGVGWAVRNGVGFGGIADGWDHIGPGGQTYNFGGTGHSGIYCEARYGDQTDPFGTNSPGTATWTGTPNSVIDALTANDPAWAAAAGKAPWLGGCTYLYLKIEYNPNLFPSGPLQTEIKVTVNGKNHIWDPRTSTYGFTNNWALCVADKLTDPVFGLGDIGGVDQAQLIAAANVCDELVPLGIGGSEKRYCLNWAHDTSMSPGAALDTMLPAAGGRLRNIGGDWHIFPAYWQGPSATHDQSALTASVQWKPKRSARDLINRVNGTYIAANYPYNSNTYPSNLYDSNGWYNGGIANTFPFAWQPTSVPQYARDVRHGYAGDQYLAQDGGIERPLELGLPCVVSITQAQRLFKIALERNRRQGSGIFEMSLAAWQGMQSLDVMLFTMAALGWTGKQLEIDAVNFRVEPGSKDNPPSIRVGFPVQETDSAVYAWSIAEELTVYDVPSNPAARPRIPAPPTSMSLTSGAATAVIGVDGVVHPRIEVQWSSPLDVQVTQIQIEYQANPAGVATGPWISAGNVNAALNLGYIADVVAGQQYNVRIRSLRSSTGATSIWEEIDGYTVSVTLSQITQLALAPGSLLGEAYSTGTASIFGFSFTASIGNLSVAVAPPNYPLTGLSQGRLYWVYYVDPTFAGGAVTAIATQNQADFLNKVGYFLIDSIVTPVYVAGGGGATGRYSPSHFADSGTRSTLGAAEAYDGDVSSSAVVSGSYSSYNLPGPGYGVAGRGTNGRCTWDGFPRAVSSSALTLTVSYSATAGDAIPYSIDAMIGTAVTNLVAASVDQVQTNITFTVPASTDLSTVSVEATVSGTSFTGGPPVEPIITDLRIFEIYIQ